MSRHVRRYSVVPALAILALVAAPANVLAHTAPEPVPASVTSSGMHAGITEIELLRYARGLGHEQ